MLKLLIFLALLASPVVGTSCYTGTFTNAPFDPSQLTKNTKCNSDYCTMETLYTDLGGVKTYYECGNWLGNGNYACDGIYSNRPVNGAAGQGTKTCCAGNYCNCNGNNCNCIGNNCNCNGKDCNSSSLSGSFMTVIFSILALFFTKFC